MNADRREFLKAVSAAGIGLAAGQASLPGAAGQEAKAAASGYRRRIAFGCWIGDMRRTPLPLQKWPAPQLDEEAVGSFIRAMDVQREAGFNLLDAWGLFATYGYPADVASAFGDKERRAQAARLLGAAAERGLGYLFGMGLFSWGYDEIIKADPEVQGHDREGRPLEHVMCGSKEKAWGYVEKILDHALGEFDFAGVHLESADLGWCDCPECGGKYGRVGYNARLNIRAAEYIRSRWPEKLVTCIPINWVPLAERPHFNEAELDEIVALSEHIDCFMDQGWTGTFVPDENRKAFIARLECEYGTSAGLWVYHCVRWDRAAYFLPYVKRTGAAIHRHFDDGARASMFYQGPMTNPGVEINTAGGGRLLASTDRSTDDVLGEVIDRYYRPTDAGARQRLVELVLQAEEAYFGQWDAAAFAERKIPMPGELHLTGLFDETPGGANYLLDPYLTAAGRKAYRQELIELLKQVASLRGQCNDEGRLERIERGLGATLVLVNTIRSAKGEG